MHREAFLMPRTPPLHLPPPRSEVMAFLAAAKKRPDDDSPRLVLADWLEEHGDVDDAGRAELVRAQCELARLSPGQPRAAELRQRERELLARHKRAWIGQLADRKLGWHFVRGLAELRLQAPTFAS